MKLFTFSLLVIATVFTLGCAENRLDVVLDQLDRPTYEVVDEVADCYDYLVIDLTQYYIAFDKVCIDLLVTGKTLEELAIETTISEILSDPDTYHAQYVALEAFVIAVEEEGVVIADVNNDLTSDILIIIDDDTGYIDTLTRGSQYKFLVQVIILEAGGGGLLLAEPVAVANE